MTQCTKPRLRVQIERMKASFLQHPEKPFNDLLPREWLIRLDEESGDYRASVFTPVVTLQAFSRQVLSADGSCKAAVMEVLAERIEQGLPACSVNTGPYCKARQRLPEAMLHEAVECTGA